MNLLFFSPYAIIDDWRFSELQLQKSLSIDNQVKIIGCKGILKKSCIAIKAHSKFYKNKKNIKKICNRCIKNQKHYNKDFETFYLENYVSKEDIDLANLELSKINKNNFVNFIFEKFEIGKIALFENMLIFKKNSLNFTDKEFEEIKYSIRDIIIFYIFLKKICKIYNPDLAFYQNGNYSISKILNLYFKDKKKITYSWEASNSYHNRFEKLFLTKNDNNFGLNYIKNNWDNLLKKKQISEKNLYSVNNHFKTIFSAKALRSFSKKYSSSESKLREYYSINESKIILLSTSSWDEIVGTYILKNKNFDKLLIFKNQPEWLDKVINYFKKNKNYRLIIRPHPRDFFNKNSEVNNYLKKIDKLPKNITLNKPDHKISLYTILKDTDLVLNSWSTLGLEAGILNLPVISISKELLMYPTEIEYFQNNEKEYFLKIEEILNNNNNLFDLKYCKNFYNFMIALIEHSSIDLNLDRNRQLYKLYKVINKASFFFSSKSILKSYLGKAKDLQSINKILNKFIYEKKNVLNEIIDKNTNKTNDIDYLKAYLEITSYVLKNDKTSKLFKKVQSLRNQIIS